MLCRSLFRKAPPRKPVASVDAHTTMGNALLTVLHAASVAVWIIGLSNVEALGGGTVQLVTHPPREGHRIDRDASVITSQTKAGDMRRQWQVEIYSQKTRQRPWQRRRQALQDKRLNRYWSSRTTTPSQSWRSGRKWNKGVCKYEYWSFETSTPSQSFRWAIYQYFHMWCLNKQW